MHRNQHSRIQPNHLEHSEFNDVVHTGYSYLKSPTFGLNTSQNIIEIQDQYITNFGVVVRYKSCCKMKL